MLPVRIFETTLGIWVDLLLLGIWLEASVSIPTDAPVLTELVTHLVVGWIIIRLEVLLLINAKRRDVFITIHLLIILHLRLLLV